MSVNALFTWWRKVRQKMFFIFLLSIPGAVTAQEVQVRGGFLSDSMKIGEQTAFYLSARYPSNVSILFPDSTHTFAPFEYEAKEYFITETTDGISRDSTVYFLTTFEVDREQFLRLPVYIVQQSDCTVVESPADTVLITQFVANVPDTVSTAELPLKMNTTYQKVHYDFNFWMMIIILGLLVFVIVVVWIFFGKRIRQYFATRRLQKRHASFIDNYNARLAQLKSAFSPPATESALVTWKKYMEELDAKPYTKMTTPETIRLIKQPSLSDHLQSIDRAIYGHNTQVVESLENLKTIAHQEYQRKLKEVQNG